jgi:SsrA-binding protein
MSNVLENKKAFFDYEIIDKFEAGVELLGHEVKSVKSGRGSIIGSYVKILNDEAYILGMKIDEYQNSTLAGVNEKDRTRKLLLNKTELKKLKKYTDEKGLTIVPLSLYIKNRWVKISIGVGRGKKHADKRETIKKRDVERSIRREYSAR